MTLNTETNLQSGIDLVAPWAAETLRPETIRADVVITRTNLLAAVGALQKAHWGYLSAITGLDHPVEAKAQPAKPAASSETPAAEKELQIDQEPWLEVLYHFCRGAAVLTLRVRLTYMSPSVPSLYSLIPSCGFFEQELAELFGIEVLGLPFTGHLVLPDDWPNGVYPLRKDFVGLTPASDKGEAGVKND